MKARSKPLDLLGFFILIIMKLTKRKGFNFFRSYYDVYNELSDKDKVAFMDALLDRQFLGKKPTDLKGMAKFAYISQTNSIDSQVKGYEDKTGTKLGDENTPTVPPTDGGSEPPTEQVQEKGKEKEQVQEKGKEKEQVQEKGKEKEKQQPKDIMSRKQIFAQSLEPYLEKYGKEMLNEFYHYWTEHNDNGKKMRFEYSKNQPFNIGRRLGTWAKNNIEKPIQGKGTKKRGEGVDEDYIQELYNRINNSDE